jgi:hypothetical protein
MGACCQTNKNQLIIDQIIAEDNIRRAKAGRPDYYDKIYNENQVKAIQTAFLKFYHRDKFFKQFLKLQNLMIQELKFNMATKNGEGGGSSDINALISNNPRIQELEARLPKFEESNYFNKNIKKYKDNKFLAHLPPCYVDILHTQDIYHGSWNINKRFEGYGILYKSDGSRYRGFWKNGILTGFVRYFTPNGDYFEGEFHNGSANGLGIYVHYDGNFYKGSWKNDQPDGEGEEFFITDNSKFKGSFKQGKKDGKGEFTWGDNSTYSGNITNDSLNGWGEYKWSDGRVYKGEWLNNQMHGKGLLKYPDNATYEGDFVDNLRTGQGKYVWNENKYYDGAWLNGKQHGKGRYFRNGKLIEGIWHMGKLMNHQLVSSNLYKPNKQYNSTQQSLENTSGMNQYDSREFSTMTNHNFNSEEVIKFNSTGLKNKS